MEAHTISWCCSCLCGACRKAQRIKNPSSSSLDRTQSTNPLNCDDPKSDFMSTGSGGERSSLYAVCGILRRNAT